MPSVSSGDSFAIVDPQSTLADEPSSSLSSEVHTNNNHTSANMNPQGSIAAIDMAADHQGRRQVTVSVRPTDNVSGYGESADVRDPQQDQRQHVAGGQPLPPGDAVNASSPTEPIDIGITTRSARAPSLSNLSDYARSMLLHTKQQMDATSGSPPPAHLHVAGPAGDQRYRSGSLNSSSNNNPVGSSHNTSTHNSSYNSYSRGMSQSTSPSRSQHHHTNSPHHHAHRQSLVNGTLPNGI
ncbi:hypothetical protein Sste5346_007636 [Sporothrix stenoceras]|uniref:Uncharacterized protein n=1 Tax=Sporothrix stenoceras TaxID=5173 RepID=A0ABR3YW59_9PEZI